MHELKITNSAMTNKSWTINLIVTRFRTNVKINIESNLNQQNLRVHYYECSSIEDLEVELRPNDPIGTSGKFSFTLCSATALASDKILSTSSPLAS